MKKTVAVLLLIILTAIVCSPVFSLGSSPTLNMKLGNGVSRKMGLTNNDFEPYQASEFPKWVLDLRRGECIFFGGIPLTYALTAAGFALAGQEQELKRNLIISASASAVIAIVDYILGVVREN